MFEIKPIFSALMRSKLGAILLLLQITITLAIVSNAVFIISDRVSYLNIETGYPEDEVFKFRVYTFGQNADLAKQVEQTQTLLKSIPGVTNAIGISEVPLSGSGSASSFSTLPLDQSDAENYNSVRAAYTSGGEHIFDTLGLKIAEGRGFLPDEIVRNSERVIPNVAVVTRTFLNELYPDAHGLGKLLHVGNQPVQIVGVIETAMGPWPSDSRPQNMIFFPALTSEINQNYIVRTSANLRDEIMSKVEETLIDQYNQRVVSGVVGLDEAKANYNSADILMLRMLVSLSVMLMLVTALGIFGMTTFNISKRTKQIGTRRALGARKSSIIRYFLVENALVSISGVIAGTGVAIVLSNQLMVLYELPKLEVIYIFGSALFILVISQLAVLLPASKAARISPSIATKTI